jgi:tetratricopeptide (TPR) repeat protein
MGYHALYNHWRTQDVADAWKLEDVQSFQVGGPNCTYLMTTRSLDIAFQFAPAEQIKVEELNEDESMRLLSHLAPEVTKREPSDTRALVQSVGGLPLALTLIGRYLHLQEYNGSPRRTRSALERLLHVEERLRLRQSIAPLERSTGMPPSISLQATIEISVQQLSLQGREALRALAVFPAKPNTFSEDVAMMVCGEAVEVFDELSDAGLLERRRPERYTLHQIISDYAHTTLKDTTAYDRLIAYYRNFVTLWPAAYEILEQESNNILAAVEAAYEFGREAELVVIIEAFAPFLLSRGLYEVAATQLDRANKAAMVLGDNTRAPILLYQGQIAQKQGHYAQAEVAFQTGLTRARQGDDPSLIVSFLADLGWVTWKQGNYNHAEAYLQEGLALARQIDDKEQMSNILKVLGSVKAAFGDYETSKTYHREGLELARHIGDRGRICVLLINLGVTSLWCGDDSQGKAYLQEGLVLARQIGHYEWISLALLNLSGAYLIGHDYKEAQQFAQEGLELARQIQHREWIGSHLINLGSIAREELHYAQSATYLQESLDLMQQIGRPSVIAEVLYEYATLRLVMQQAEAAEDLLQQMKAVIPDGDRPLLALWQYGIARLAALRGKRDDARQIAEISKATLVDVGNFHVDEVDTFLATLADSSSTHL